jgi:NitT/TauT family transport system permease protein
MRPTAHIPLKAKLSVFLKQPKNFANSYDFIALILIMSLLALAMLGVEDMHQPLAKLSSIPISTSLSELPKYALYTTLRMFAAIIASLVFTFTVAALAAKNKKAEMLIIPVLDVLQSVPVLGFLTFTVTFFMGLFPGNQMGVELAAIFAVFTAQAWSMTFSFYQSLRTVPHDLKEASAQFCQNSWQRFWKLEVPFGMPNLVWNTMMSMSGSWFFVVASEAISVGNTQVSLPGIGSWLGLAINNKDLTGVAWAVVAMAILILLYDQLIFRPLIAWSNKFNMGKTLSQQQPRSWVYNVLTRSKLMQVIARCFQIIADYILAIKWPNIETNVGNIELPAKSQSKTNKIIDLFWFISVTAIVIESVLFLLSYLHSGGISLNDIIEVFDLASVTCLRVVILVFLASLLWIPVGVFIGLRPRMVALAQPLAQFLAAFPANILFPFVVIIIVKYELDPNIWLSPLMILGAQWYIFFNVIAGVSVFPNDLKEAATIYNVRSWIWWKRVILPGILPYYLTGALAATGGCWNAAIVAEIVNWGPTTLEAYGLGAYIAEASTAGNMHRVLLGVGVMSIFVIIFNRIFWKKLYLYSEKLTGQDKG